MKIMRAKFRIMITAESHMQVYYATYFVCLASFICALNFDNRGVGEVSYATYSNPAWILRPHASLEFSFKTNLYGTLFQAIVSTEGRKSVKLSLSIVENGGILNACYSYGCLYQFDNPLKTASLGSKWNNMEWHKVQIRKMSSEIFLNIDGIEAILTEEEKKEDDFRPLIVYVGASYDLDEHSRFTGCIENVSYPIGTIRSPGWSSSRVRKECLDSTCFKEKKSCNEVQCGTSSCGCKDFFTPTPIYSIMPSYYLNLGTIIRDTIDPPLLHSRVNTIEMRFRSIQPNGILMYSGGSSNYILLEMIDGYLQINWSMGSGNVKITSDVKLHDGSWHAVTLKRSGQKVVLNIDGRYRGIRNFLYYPPTLMCNLEPQLVYFGGYVYPENIEESKVKTNFQGCLQQIFIYNEMARSSSTYEYMKGARKMGNRRSVVEGNLTKCVMKKLSIGNVTSSYREGVKEEASKLTQNTVAWITAGICVGAIAMIFTLACGFHLMRKKYSGHFTAKAELNGAYQFGTTSSKLTADSNFKNSLNIPNGTIV